MDGPEIPPIDCQGIPTTDLAYRVLDLMYENRHAAFSPAQLTIYFRAGSRDDAKTICNQLKELDFLVEDPTDPQKFRYNLRCKDTERQGTLERFLLYVELEMFDVSRALPNSPSFR